MAPPKRRPFFPAWVMVVITSIKYIAFCQGGARHEDELQPHLTLIHSFLHLYHLFFIMYSVALLYFLHLSILLFYFHPLNFLYIRPSHTRTTTQHSIAYIIFAASFSSFFICFAMSFSSSCTKGCRARDAPMWIIDYIILCLIFIICYVLSNRFCHYYYLLLFK